jgi:hypothetical protein
MQSEMEGSSMQSEMEGSSMQSEMEGSSMQSEMEGSSWPITWMPSKPNSRLSSCNAFPIHHIMDMLS